MSLAPLPTSERITDAVYLKLRDAIIRGDLAAGARLSVPRLAEQLGVSRSPVREAVVRLIEDGLVQELPRRGAVVLAVTRQQLASLYEVREVLEGLATRLAALRVDDDLIGVLSALLESDEEAVRAGDVNEHVEQDVKFHKAIRDACGNEGVIHFLDNVAARVRLAMVTTIRTYGPENALMDHRRILEAIRSGDADDAERSARIHVANLYRAIVPEAAPA